MSKKVEIIKVLTENSFEKKTYSGSMKLISENDFETVAEQILSLVTNNKKKDKK